MPVLAPLLIIGDSSRSQSEQRSLISEWIGGNVFDQLRFDDRFSAWALLQREPKRDSEFVHVGQVEPYRGGYSVKM